MPRASETVTKYFIFTRDPRVLRCLCEEVQQQRTTVRAKCVLIPEKDARQVLLTHGAHLSRVNERRAIATECGHTRERELFDKTVSRVKRFSQRRRVQLDAFFAA